MLIEHLGHAGFLVEEGDSLVVMDPWLSPAGAFDRAWFQFPCNHHLADRVVERARAAGRLFVYVSHEHKDHFDAALLARLVPLRPTVLLAAFRTKGFRDAVRAIGFDRVVEVADEDSVDAGDLAVRLFVDDGALNRDSAVLVSDGRRRFLNLNDCKIFDRARHIADRYGPIDVLAGQFSGAVWHPTCYEYHPDKYRKLAYQKRMSKFRSVLEVLKTLRPRRYFPSAGPACFLDRDLLEVNFQDVNIFPHAFEVAAFLRRKIPEVIVDEVMPGDVFDGDRDAFTALGSERIDAATVRPYIEGYAARLSPSIEAIKRPHDAAEAAAVLDRFRAALADKLEHFRPESRFAQELYFGLDELPGRFVRVDLNGRAVDAAESLPDDNFYRFTFPAWQVARLVEGAINWSDLALTFRAKILRCPDQYDTLINGFIISETEDLEDLVENIEGFRRSRERIVVEADGGQYEINRFCPHQGADLTYGWADAGAWVCPRHRWRFDLENEGRCAASADCVAAVRVDAES